MLRSRYRSTTVLDSHPYRLVLIWKIGMVEPTLLKLWMAQPTPTIVPFPSLVASPPGWPPLSFRVAGLAAFILNHIPPAPPIKGALLFAIAVFFA